MFNSKGLSKMTWSTSKSIPTAADCYLGGPSEPCLPSFWLLYILFLTLDLAIMLWSVGHDTSRHLISILGLVFLKCSSLEASLWAI